MSSVAKTSSMKLGVLGVFHTLLTLNKGLVSLCMKYFLHVWEGSTLVALLDGVESKAFQLINCSSLTEDVVTLALFPSSFYFSVVFYISVIIFCHTSGEWTRPSTWESFCSHFYVKLRFIMSNTKKYPNKYLSIT